MIGRLISGRYRVEAKVGMGGMAVVYRALDQQENRIVAIKVLRPEYQGDEEFVRRFSREAEAAAKVFHENIVNLLDVGIDGDMRYIVMEYVDGRTLKEMIRDEGRIHPDVAIRMTIRILAAVDHAHRNGIVHRDIKPQNILVDRNGVVKVADFGIARLKTAQTTKLDADGSALGSVHYLSPEQASGEVADEQSDLYSVGVVMYEMLTGHVPFDGDTAVSVALKHVHDTPRSMREDTPGIPRALDEVVMRALCKDKKRRYQTAAEMAADLRKAIVRPRGGFVHYPSQEPQAQDDAGNGAVPEKKRRVRPAGLRRFVLPVCGVLVLALLLGFGMLYYSRVHGRIVMPALIGMPQAQAVSAVRECGVQDVAVVNAYSDEFEAGQVMLQSRAEGERLTAETTVTLTVSLGSQWYELPRMVGWNATEAIAKLADAGANDVRVEYVQSDQPSGIVLSQSEAPGRTSRDTPVVLRVSGQSVAVPSLMGLTLEGAQAVIEAEGLNLGNVSQGESADAASGTVIAQSVAPYTQVLLGTAVDLTICRAREANFVPQTPLTVQVPLENVLVEVRVIAPSGQTQEVLNERMSAGTHTVRLSSAEAGMHRIQIYIDGVLWESLELSFE